MLSKSTGGPARPPEVPGLSKGDLSTQPFRPLRELADITDKDTLKRELLARLDDIYDRAVKRERTVGKAQVPVLDPDGHTACKVVEAAADILEVKVKSSQTPADLSVFATAKPEAA